MKYIKPKCVRLKGLRSFVDEQVFSIPDHGLIGIKGDSGAGKTNLHLSIAYPLGYSPLPQSELQSWDYLTDNKLQVEIDFDTYLGPVTIARGESSFIKIGDKLTNASAKAIAAELQRLFEIPLELLEALTFRPQGEPARFISMTDSQKKEFLSKVLGLEAIEKEIEAWTKTINLTQASLETRETVISTLKSQLQDIKEPKLIGYKDLYDKLVQKEQAADSFKQLVAHLEKAIREIEATFKPDTTKIESINIELGLLLAQKNKLENEFVAAQKSLQEALKEKRRLLRDTQEEIKRLETIHPRIVAKTAVLNGLMKAQCPTCEQQWIPKDDKYAKTKEELYQLAEQYCKLDDIKPVQDLLVSEIEELQGKHDSWANPELDALAVKIRELDVARAKEQAEIKFQKESVLKEKYLEYSKAKEAYNKLDLETTNLSNQIEMAKAQDNYALKTYARAKSANEELLKKIDKEQAEADKLKTKFETESDYVELLKTFLGTIFEEVLYEISLETNELLKNLPNVSTRTIQFVTERTTQKGTTKQEIKPIVIINNNPCSLRALSGGQKNAVGLAIDLALASVITKRTGLNLGWQVFDESFDGMDLKTKESCLELLKKAAQDKVIFTIDHFSEINEMYEKVLYVENSGETSTIREINAI